MRNPSIIRASVPPMIPATALPSPDCFVGGSCPFFALVVWMSGAFVVTFEVLEEPVDPVAPPSGTGLALLDSVIEVEIRSVVRVGCVDGWRVVLLVICGVDVFVEAWGWVELLRVGGPIVVRVWLLARLVRAVVAGVEVSWPRVDID